ncbi:hypothetical protein FKM82_008822 [Ascaphus truei]
MHLKGLPVAAPAGHRKCLKVPRASRKPFSPLAAAYCDAGPVDLRYRQPRTMFHCGELLNMALRLRAIVPYTLPGVLALIGWWWFFSRKKDQRDDKQKRISARADKQKANDAQIELVLTEEVMSSSWTQPVQRNPECAPQSCISCSVSSVEMMASSFKSNFDITSEYSANKSEAENNIACPSQEFPEPMLLSIHSNNIDKNILKSKSIDHGDKAEDLLVCTSTASKQVFHSSPEATIRKVEHDSIQGSENVGSEYITLDESSCDYVYLSELDAKSDMKIPAENEDIVQMGRCAEKVPTHLGNRPSFMENTNIAVAQLIKAERLGATLETSEIEDGTGETVCRAGNEIHELNSTEKCTQVEALHKNDLSDEFLVESLGKESVQICSGEVETVVNIFVQCPQTMANKAKVVIDIDARKESNADLSASQSLVVENVQPGQVTENLPAEQDDKASASEEETVEYSNFESLKSQGVESVVVDVLSNSCTRPACTELLRKDESTSILNTFSQCMGNAERFETSGTIADNMEEQKNEAVLENHEALTVEQLARNIISKVIVAATQEILSGTVSDMSDSGCHILDSEIGDSIDREACTFVLEQNVSASVGQDESFDAKEYLTKSTQKEEQKHVEVRCKVGSVSNACPVQQTEVEEHKPKNSVHKTQKEPDLSPVHRVADSFDEAHAVTEHSSLSVSTLEDGMGMEEPLQSTALSCVGVVPYDTLSTSGIELSSEQVTVSSEKTKKVRVVEDKCAPFSNGDVKRGSPDLKNGGPWTAETEADHSGGSDVNSMDSVDSGFALGKTEELQNVKQRSESKKSELVIWEIEVPKHLVGRLIGKQGRFVSFLKETSGAKIYISTLPYTQEFQICHTEGSQQQVDRALSLIGKKFKELNLTNIYAPPPSPTLHSLPMTSWLMLPDGVTVEVIVVNVVNAGHVFVQQHTHPTFHALRSLDQQMYLCYSQPGIPTLPTPVEVGVICAAPAGEDAWWRAQVVAYLKDSEEVEIRYVDYGGYEKVKIEILRQIRSDFVTLPFQGAEVLLDNMIPLPEEAHFSLEADDAVNEMTRDTALLAQVTNYDGATGLPLIQLWSMMGDEVVSINRSLVERGFAQWIDSY